MHPTASDVLIKALRQYKNRQTSSAKVSSYHSGDPNALMLIRSKLLAAPSDSTSVENVKLFSFVLRFTKICP